MTEEFRIIITDESTKMAGAAASGGGAASVSGSAGGLGAKFAGGFALMQEGISIISEAISSVLKPVRTVVVQIGKMLAEFIRPVTEVLVIALLPMINMLKPMVSLFRTFMNPFIAIAREWSNISNSLFASGNQTQGMEAAMMGVQSLIMPFIVSITSVGMQLANTLITSSVTNLLIGVSQLIEGALRFITPSVMDDKITEVFDGLRNNITTMGNDWLDTSNAWLTTKTEEILGGLQTDAQAKLDEFKSMTETQLTTSLVETPGSIYSEAGIVAKTGMTTIKTEVDTGFGQLETSASSFKDKLQEVAKAINEIKIKAPSRERERSDRSNVYFGGSNFVIASFDR